MLGGWGGGQVVFCAHPLPFFLQGVPFPQNEANAMDVVVQFAIHRLGFQPQDIILYAWSIGGFTGNPPPSYPATVGTLKPSLCLPGSRVEERIGGLSEWVWKKLSYLSTLYISFHPCAR